MDSLIKQKGMEQMMSKKISLGEKIFKVCNYIFVTLLTLATLFPLVHVVAMSFSSSRAILSGEVLLWPVEITLDAYRNMIKTGQIFQAMKNTVIVTVVGTFLNMLFSILAAYPLSKPRLVGKKFFTWLIMFTMMFSGGMIPSFILVKMLGMNNSYFALWIPPLISVYNMIILRTFFQGLPESLMEAAAIDGANEVYILLRIVLPLSKAALATVGLFYAVGFWNNYMDAMIYITDSDKFTLMVRLRQMLSNLSNEMLLSGEGASAGQSLTPEAVKAASIVVATLPIMCVYPFLQKYFVKGVTIGSVKG